MILMGEILCFHIFCSKFYVLCAFCMKNSIFHINFYSKKDFFLLSVNAFIHINDCIFWQYIF